MAAKKADRLPAPPADLSTRDLPITSVKGPIYRIFRTTRGWDYFGTGKSERFDDPARKYGVLYAAIRPDAAFAEVFLRTLSPMIVAERDLVDRSLVTIVTRPLRCVDLLSEGLRKISCDNRVSTEQPYNTTGLWSRAFFEHPAKPDGIIYRSRHNPDLRCLALFDRCRPKLRPKNAVIEELMGTKRRGWTADQLDKYDLAMVPL
jgi:hypothetical protein